MAATIRQPEFGYKMTSLSFYTGEFCETKLTRGYSRSHPWLAKLIGEK
jgi:hypothetical protein